MFQTFEILTMRQIMIGFKQISRTSLAFHRGGRRFEQTTLKSIGIIRILKTSSTSMVMIRDSDKTSHEFHKDSHS